MRSAPKPTPEIVLRAEVAQNEICWPQMRFLVFGPLLREPSVAFQSVRSILLVRFQILERCSLQGLTCAPGFESVSKNAVPVRILSVTTSSISVRRRGKDGAGDWGVCLPSPCESKSGKDDIDNIGHRFKRFQADAGDIDNNPNRCHWRHPRAPVQAYLRNLPSHSRRKRPDCYKAFGWHV
jgi:hypothetical protein